MLGGGAGSILDMIIRYRNNRSQLRKKSIFKNDHEYFDSDKVGLASRKGRLVFKKVSKTELEEYRTKIIERRKKEIIRNVVVFFVIMTALSFIVVKVLGMGVREAFKGAERHKSNFEEVKLKDKYDFFMMSGDEWRMKKHWHNAIFMYKKAFEIFPSDYMVRFRLAESYTFRCKQENLDCERAGVKLDELIGLYPDSVMLYELRFTYYQLNGYEDKALEDLNMIESLRSEEKFPL